MAAEDAARFDRAFAAVTANVQLGYLQQQWLAQVRAALFPSLGPPLPMVELVAPPTSGASVFQVWLGAATVLLGRGDVCSFHLTGRQSAQWFQHMAVVLLTCKDHAEFGWVEVMRRVPKELRLRITRPGAAAREVSVRALPCGQYDNLRGMGARLALFLIDAPGEAIGMDIIAPLLVNGGTGVRILHVARPADATGTRSVLDTYRATQALLPIVALLNQEDVPKT